MFEENCLIGKKQGITKVYITYEDDQVTEYTIACSTYNDDKDPGTTWEHSIYTIKGEGSALITGHYELQRDTINTITDCIEWFCYSLFSYGIEPAYRFAFEDGDYEREIPWDWMPPAEVIMDYGSGVCCQIAQVAAYLLQDDFEDMGFILINGYEGHIFNWFMENGKYYVFDFTTVVCEQGCPADDYTNRYLKVFDSPEDIKNWIASGEKVNLDRNIVVFMYSSLGHDYVCTSYNGNSHGIDKKKNFTYKFENCVIEDENFLVLYQNPNYTVNIIGVDSLSVPKPVIAAGGTYGAELKTYVVDYNE